MIRHQLYIFQLCFINYAMPQLNTINVYSNVLAIQQGEFQCYMHNFNIIIYLNHKHMSLYPRNQTQTNYKPQPHPNLRKDQIHNRSVAQHWRGSTDFDFTKEGDLLNEENKFSVPRYQNDRIQQKYRGAHQRSQGEHHQIMASYQEISPNRSNYNDFSFEQANRKTKNQLSNDMARQNSRRMGTEMKISNIDQLNDKIYSLLQMVKKETSKTSTSKKGYEKSVSPYRNNNSSYNQRSIDKYSNLSKDNKSISKANPNLNHNNANNRHQNDQIRQVNPPLSSIQNSVNHKGFQRNQSNKQPKLSLPNATNPNSTLYSQNKNTTVNNDKTQSSLRTKFARQSNRHQKSLYENNQLSPNKHQVAKRQEKQVIKSIDDLLNQRRRMLNLNSKDEQVSPYRKNKEIKQQQGSPINQYRNKQGLYTIQQKESESSATHSQVNKQKKYQYFLQINKLEDQNNQHQGSIKDEKHFDFSGKIYKKSQQALTPKKSRHQEKDTS